MNAAARVHELSHGSDIVLTEQVLRAPGTEELLAEYAVGAESVELEGIDEAVRIHRVASRAGSGSPPP